MDEGPQDWPSDTDSEEHFDPAAVDRPPPLDSRTEALLREACTSIVQNLRPSGYDIEDTRMKTDILVDDLSDQDELPITALPARKQQQKSGNPASSTWYKEGSDRNSSTVPTIDSINFLDKRKSGPSAADVAAIHAKRKYEHKRLANALREEQGQNAPELLQVEAPIAPLASVRLQSRNEPTTPNRSQILENPNVSAPENTSLRTVSTSKAKPTNITPFDTTSTATGPSANIEVTPITKSTASTFERTPEQTKAELRSANRAPTAASAGAWMKEEIEKRKVAQTTVSEPRAWRQAASSVGIKHPDSGEQAATLRHSDGSMDLEDLKRPEEGYLQAQMVPIVYSRASSMRSDVEGGSPTTKQDPPRPGVVNGAVENANIEDDLASDPYRPPPPAAPAAATPQQGSPVRSVDGRGGGVDVAGDESRRTTPATSQLILAEERHVQTSSSPPVSANTVQSQTHSLFANDSFDITLAQIRARMAATSLSSHPISSKLVSSKDAGALTSESEGTSRWPIPPRFSSVVPPSTLSPKEEKHRNDDTIRVKDFWQPSRTQSENERLPQAKALAAVKAATGKSLRKDIDPVGFDAFMSVVEHTNHGSDGRHPSLNDTHHKKSHSAASRRLSNGSTNNYNAVNGKYGFESPAPLSSPSTSGPRSPPLPPLPEGIHRRYSSQTVTYMPTPMSRPTSSSRSTGHQKSSAFPQPQRNSQSHIESFQREAPLLSTAAQTNASVVSSLPQNSKSPIQRPPVPQPVQSPSRLSISSRAPSARISAPGIQAAGKTSSSGLKKWLGRRKSLSLLAKSNNSNNFGNGMNGLTYPSSETYHVVNGYGGIYEDEEYDDPLVCAAPVVAFGRGW